MRLQEGAAAAATKNIENNPMQSSRRPSQPTVRTEYLTRRANHQHNFIIAKSVEATAGAQRMLSGEKSDETPSPMIGRCVVTASMH
jgi:hypothetical protein